MQRIGDRPLTIDLSAEDRDAMAAVEEVVFYWSEGTLPLAEVLALTTSRDRNIAIRYMPMADPLYPKLLKLLDAIVDQGLDQHGQAAYRTRHGLFTEDELHAARARHERTDDGHLLFRFPIRQPWDSPPVTDRNGNRISDGIPGKPIYAGSTFEQRIGSVDGNLDTRQGSN